MPNPAPPAGPTAALIVAAGRGSRLADASDGLAKQYVQLSGKSVLAWSMESLLTSPEVSHVQVVIHPGDQSLYNDVTNNLDMSREKLLPPVFGGETRQQSVRNGLNALRSHNPATVLIHDAARPFLTHGVVSALQAALEVHPGAIPALPVVDTLKRTGHETRVNETVPREHLWRAQTPQAFHFETILQAHVAAEQSRTDFTDDGSIAEAAGHTVVLVPGDETLRKLTTREDLVWARNHSATLLGETMQHHETRVGQGFDVHAFADGDAVVLCGVSIPFHKRLSGHSDADVGLHALTDAILGALADGDIGTHFPPSDPQWKGADSVVFLEDALRRVSARGGQVRHIDLTLICEEPKVGPHRPAMTATLERLTGLSETRISIKATTTERLGFPGRGEGIAALATATVALPPDD